MSTRRNRDSPSPSLASVCAHPPGIKGEGTHSPADEGLESQFRRLEKSLALRPPTLWWYVQQQELIVTHRCQASFRAVQVRPPSNLPSHTAKNQYRKFETKIPRKGIARPQSQFSHSSVCERFIHILPRTIDLPLNISMRLDFLTACDSSFKIQN